jgi:hypothetical protein
VYAYLLNPYGFAEKTALTGAFLKHKMLEYENLRVGIESLKFEVTKLIMKKFKNYD